MKTNITKQIILGTIITLGLFSAAKAQTAYDDQQYSEPQQYSNNQPQQYQQPQYAPQQYQQPVETPAPVVQQGFYYYPDANVYYDPSCNHYIYYNGGAWLSVNVLPRGFFLGGSRYMVYHRGPQVWLDNPIHIRNYYRGGYRAGVAYNYRGFAPRNNFRVGYVGRGGYYGHGYRRF